MTQSTQASLQGRFLFVFLVFIEPVAELMDRLLTARIQARVTDPEMLAFCERETHALLAEVEKQLDMSPEERAQHVTNAAG